MDIAGIDFRDSNNSGSAESSYFGSAPAERSVKSGHAACGRFYHAVELFDGGWNSCFRHSFGLGRSADTFRSTRGRMNQDQGSENKYLNASTQAIDLVAVQEACPRHGRPLAYFRPLYNGNFLRIPGPLQ